MHNQPAMTPEHRRACEKLRTVCNSLTLAPSGDALAPPSLVELEVSARQCLAVGAITPVDDEVAAWQRLATTTADLLATVVLGPDRAVVDAWIAARAETPPMQPYENGCESR